MWLGQFTGTCQKNMGLSEVRGGMTMSRTVYLKMRISKCYATLVYGKAMRSRLGDQIY